MSVRLDDGAWGELRSLLATPPSGWAWARLWAWIDARAEVIEDARVVTYLTDHLSRWPEAARIVPRSLWAALDAGQAHPLLPLCPMWQLIDPEGLDLLTLHHHPQRDTARALDLSLRREEALSSDDLVTLVADPMLDGLRALSLDDSHIWSATDDHSADWPGLLSQWRLPGLRALSLAGQRLSDDAIEALARCDALAALRALRLQRGWLSIDHVARLMSAPALRALEVLRVSAAAGHQLGVAGDAREARGEAPARLHTLELVGPIVGRWEDALAALPRPPALRRLILGEPERAPEVALRALRDAGWLDGVEEVCFVEGAMRAASLPEPLVESLPRGCRVILHTCAPDAAPRREGQVELLPSLDAPSPQTDDVSGWWAWTPGAAEDPSGRAIVPAEGFTAAAQAAPPDRQPIPRIMSGWGGVSSADVMIAADEIGEALASLDTLSVDFSASSTALRDVFIEEVAPLTDALRTLLWHDCDDLRRQMSWLQSCELSPVLHALPSLRAFALKAGLGSRFEGLRHEALRVLIVQCGGMSRALLDDLLRAELPELSALELWFGDPFYGCEVTPEDLAPLLAGELFPKLKHLGLCNAPWADRAAHLLHGAPLLRRLDTLDLSRGIFTDAGVRALMGADLSGLRRLEVGLGYVRDRAQLQQIARQGVLVTGAAERGWRDPLETETGGYGLYVDTGE